MFLEDCLQNYLGRKERLVQWIQKVRGFKIEERGILKTATWRCHNYSVVW